MQKGQTFGVIGAGVMGRALLRGMLNAGVVTRDQAWASARSEATCARAAAELGVPVETDISGRLSDAGVILVCVKPYQAAVALAAAKESGLRPDTLLISVLAGTKITQLEIFANNPWVRSMPNTPSVIGEGMTVICPGTQATADHMTMAEEIFAAVGKCIAADESLFDACTAMSGSGPAFQYLILEAFADAGVRVGLPRPLALALAAQTAVGAARMVQQTGRHPAQLRDDVTTPGGCTIAGLMKLEEGKIRAVLTDAIEEAAKVAGQLGQSKPNVQGK